MPKVIFQNDEILMVDYDHHIFFINKAQAKNEQSEVMGYYTSGAYTYQILEKSLYGDYVTKWINKFSLD